MINIKRYKELDAKWALKQCELDDTCKKYVPDAWFKANAKICRKYLLAVLATHAGDYFTQIVTNANEIRENKVDLSGKDLELHVCDELRDVLSNVPYCPKVSYFIYC